MATRRAPKPYDRRYYGPLYNPRADNRSPTRTYNEGAPPAAQTGVYKRGKPKTVLRDTFPYTAYNQRPKRS